MLGQLLYYYLGFLPRYSPQLMVPSQKAAGLFASIGFTRRALAESPF